MSDVTTNGTEPAYKQTVITDNTTVVIPSLTPAPHVSFYQHYVQPALAASRKALAWVKDKIQPYKNEIWAAYVVFLAVLLVIFAPKATLTGLGGVVLASGWIAYYGLRKRIKSNEGGQ